MWTPCGLQFIRRSFHIGYPDLSGVHIDYVEFWWTVSPLGLHLDCIWSPVRSSCGLPHRVHMSTWSPHGVQKIVAVAPDRVHIESTWAPYRVHVDSKRNVAQCKALEQTKPPGLGFCIGAANGGVRE